MVDGDGGSELVASGDDETATEAPEPADETESAGEDGVQGRGGTATRLARRNGIGLIAALIAGGAVIVFGVTTTSVPASHDVGPGSLGDIAGGSDAQGPDGAGTSNPPTVAGASGSGSSDSRTAAPNSATTSPGQGSTPAAGSASTPAIGAPAGVNRTTATSTTAPVEGGSNALHPTTTTTTTPVAVTTTTTTTVVTSGGPPHPVGPGPISLWYAPHQAALTKMANDCTALSGAVSKYSNDSSAPRLPDRKKKVATDLKSVVSDAATLAHDVAPATTWPAIPSAIVQGTWSAALSALTQSSSALMAGHVTTASTGELGQGAGSLQQTISLLQFAQLLGV
jgi:hypothetical protein